MFRLLPHYRYNNGYNYIFSANPKLIFKYKDHGLDGIVDGMTIDTDGNLWVANFDASQVHNENKTIN